MPESQLSRWRIVSANLLLTNFVYACLHLFSTVLTFAYHEVLTDYFTVRLKPGAGCNAASVYRSGLYQCKDCGDLAVCSSEPLPYYCSRSAALAAREMYAWVLSKIRKIQYSTVTINRVREYHEMRKTHGFHARMVSEEGCLTRGCLNVGYIL